MTHVTRDNLHLLQIVISYKQQLGRLPPKDKRHDGATKARYIDKYLHNSILCTCDVGNKAYFVKET